MVAFLGKELLFGDQYQKLNTWLWQMSVLFFGDIVLLYNPRIFHAIVESHIIIIF